MKINYVDIVCDLSWGDTGKGKVSSFLSKTEDYDFVCRWAGGNNAGHTVYLNNKKYKTHLIPCGVFHGIKSIIGPDCVLNVKSFLEEVKYLEDNGFDTSLIKVSPKTNIVTEEHIDRDKAKLHSKLGTTAKGIAPCYSDKMLRVGLQAKDVQELKDFIWDERLYGNILCEGAQGFYLDINYGNYPYVTSSSTLPYAACSLGFSPKKVRNIWGLCKLYDTRSGVDTLFPNSLLEDKNLLRLGDLGKEYGVTTGRRRTCNWLNLDLLINAINKSGTTHLVINKCDILYKLGLYKLYYQNKLLNFTMIEDMKQFIENKIRENCYDNLEYIRFSSSPEEL
jgi:adenylosuccinate synthase